MHIASRLAFYLVGGQGLAGPDALEPVLFFVQVQSGSECWRSASSQACASCVHGSVGNVRGLCGERDMLMGEDIGVHGADKDSGVCSEAGAGRVRSRRYLGLRGWWPRRKCTGAFGWSQGEPLQFPQFRDAASRAGLRFFGACDRLPFATVEILT